MPKKLKPISKANVGKAKRQSHMSKQKDALAKALAVSKAARAGIRRR